MVNFRRSKIKGGTYFFTVNLKDRRSQHLIKHIDLLRYAMQSVNTVYQFQTKAIVVLPDHLHAIWQLPENDDNYSIRWMKIKYNFTRSLIKRGINLSKNRLDEYDLWQRRFWEHTIKNEEDYQYHVNYIHYNPVKHGYVKGVIDWPYSSFHKYVKLEILPADWSSNESFAMCLGESMEL